VAKVSAGRRVMWSTEAFRLYERILGNGHLSKTQLPRLVAKQLKAKKHLQ
jgi:hypothetical protein